MNKSNKLLLILLTFVVACVVGYALFSDSIKITGTASASGDWSIVATCQTGIASEATSYTNQIITMKEGGYSGDACSVTGGTKVNLSTSLLYPSAARHFTVKITNKGNIPATIDTIDDESIFSTVIFKNVTSEVCNINSDNQKENCDKNVVYDGGSSNFVQDHIIGFSDATGKFYSFEEGEEFIKAGSGLLALEKDESIYVVISLYWSKNYVSPTNKAHMSFDVSGDIEFIQATE